MKIKPNSEFEIVHEGTLNVGPWENVFEQYAQFVADVAKNRFLQDKEVDCQYFLVGPNQSVTQLQTVVKADRIEVPRQLRQIIRDNDIYGVIHACVCVDHQPVQNEVLVVSAESSDGYFKRWYWPILKKNTEVELGPVETITERLPDPFANLFDSEADAPTGGDIAVPGRVMKAAESVNQRGNESESGAIGDENRISQIKPASVLEVMEEHTLDNCGSEAEFRSYAQFLKSYFKNCFERNPSRHEYVVLVGPGGSMTQLRIVDISDRSEVRRQLIRMIRTKQIFGMINMGVIADNSNSTPKATGMALNVFAESREGYYQRWVWPILRHGNAIQLGSRESTTLRPFDGFTDFFGTDLETTDEFCRHKIADLTDATATELANAVRCGTGWAYILSGPATAAGFCGPIKDITVEEDVVVIHAHSGHVALPSQMLAATVLADRLETHGDRKVIVKVNGCPNSVSSISSLRGNGYGEITVIGVAGPIADRNAGDKEIPLTE